MGVLAEEFRKGRDIYIFYDMEEYFFRYSAVDGKTFCKRMGSTQEYAVPYDDRLWREAIRFGDEVTEEQYRSAGI